jgi:hypothetical protein
MRWTKLGLIGFPALDRWWARSSAVVPTPVALSDEVLRVYITHLDGHGVGRVGYIDLDSANPLSVRGVSLNPILDIGNPGCFDDNGVLAVSVVSPEPNTLFMYYAGFELANKIRYRIFTGLAVSSDGGETFKRVSRAPILDRSDGELFFRCGPFVLYEDGKFRLWYVAGSQWTLINGKQAPVYDLRYQESEDGVHWGDSGRVSMEITGLDEHGFGRPWIVRRGPSDYQLFYSIRRRSLQGYRLGYAESADGVEWARKDGELGLDVTPGSFDGQAIMYSAVISAHGRTYCFYNGDNFGERGFAVAVLEG